MGLDSLLQQNMQNSGLAGSHRLARNAMFPQSQMDKTQYAVSNQLPTGAQTIDSDYDTPTNAYTGLATQPFAYGGIARYDGEDGSVVTDTPVEPTAPLTMAELAAKLKQEYNTNADYVPTWQQFASLKETDPVQWHKHQLDWLGHHQGWQIGQNTSDRNAAEMPVIQDEIEQARKAGVSDKEIQQILSGSQQSANYQNQQRIAQEGASAKGGGFGELAKVAAPIALSMVLGPEMLALAPELGAMGAGALTGGAVGGIGAGITGGDVGKGILMGGATGALGGAMNGINPDVAQGINAAKSAYSLTQNPKNPMAAINAFKGISSLAPVEAAHGGLMAAGGLSTLGSYSDGGRLLKGPGDGMSDNIPAKIGQSQPARLADGEFVVPADVVSHLGNGSTDAGAKQLYAMMDKIRKARTGNKKQGKQINPSKFLP